MNILGLSQYSGSFIMKARLMAKLDFSGKVNWSTLDAVVVLCLRVNGAMKEILCTSAMKAWVGMSRYR